LDDLLLLYNIDITHLRLVDLTRLADQAKPFYDWVEKEFQTVLKRDESLNILLLTTTHAELISCIRACYASSDTDTVPLLFDGIGRSYSHKKACFYFFAWLIRDAPQQRLTPLITRMLKNTSSTRTDIEIEVLAALIVKYRPYVTTFAWDAIREVIIDRLEGSRRSIRGHEKEVIVRTALLSSVQDYFTRNQNYGVYGRVEIPASQIIIGNETYDVSVSLIDHTETVARRILVPIKTRETEGGGHAHLFSRDILSAIRAVRQHSSADFVAVVIIATNWSARETENLREIVDHLIVFEASPTNFHSFDTIEQERLNQFIADVLNGTSN
jgi:hypothetical protein